MSRHVSRTVTAGAAGIVVLAGGWFVWNVYLGHTPIREVLANSDRLQGKEIDIRAEVREGSDLLGYGAYQLDDHTGRIWVLTSSGSPIVGRTVKVRGRVKRMLQIPSVVQHALALPGSQVVGLEEIRRD